MTWKLAFVIALLIELACIVGSFIQGERRWRDRS
jgi:hypothetical protein